MFWSFCWVWLETNPFEMNDWFLFINIIRLKLIKIDVRLSKIDDHFLKDEKIENQSFLTEYSVKKDFVFNRFRLISIISS